MCGVDITFVCGEVTLRLWGGGGGNVEAVHEGVMLRLWGGV